MTTLSLPIPAPVSTTAGLRSGDREAPCEPLIDRSADETPILENSTARVPTIMIAVDESSASVDAVHSATDPNRFVVDWAKHLASDLHPTLLPVFAYNAICNCFEYAGNYRAGEKAARAEAASEAVYLSEMPGRLAQVLSDITGAAAYLIIVGARREHALGGHLLGRVVDHLLQRPPSPSSPTGPQSDR